jgi:dTDP-4-dehydrorhamnose 3,5-epimerase
MTFVDLPIVGAKLLAVAPFKDDRGIFEVFWEQAELATEGITFTPVSAHHSYNEKAGTLRGMHYQKPPLGQSKLVSCVSGRVWDVVADLRPDSPTYLRWEAVELSAASGRAVFIPAGCAHGFVTLTDQATVAYLIQGNYEPAAAGTVRWNDPTFGIQWPVNSPILSERDRLAPDFIA